MRLVMPFSDVYMIIGNNSCCVEITFEEDHLCWRGRSPNKEVELLLLLSLGILYSLHLIMLQHKFAVNTLLHLKHLLMCKSPLERNY